MNIKIIKFGKVAHDATEVLAKTYLQRIRKPWSVELFLLKESKGSGSEIFSKDKNRYWIALTEEGRTFTTMALSKKIEKKFSDPAVKSIGFIIGGPFGLSSEIKSLANELLSLSPLTFTSDFALALLCEQLYRVQSILNGQEYHHL